MILPLLTGSSQRNTLFSEGCIYEQFRTHNRAATKLRPGLGRIDEVYDHVSELHDQHRMELNAD